MGSPVPAMMRAVNGSRQVSAPMPLRPGGVHGMVRGMATSKLTITLENEQLDEVRKLVSAGASSSVSAFVKHAVGIALHDAAGWKEMLDGALRETGGPLTRKERAWADAILAPKRPKRGPKKGRAA
jgi:Arc/MetJ-type ribon-helix-helix transcriptional regulator